MSSNENNKKRQTPRTWDEGYADLRAFFMENGHSQPGCTTLVGRWAADQRKKRNRGELTDVQIERLNEIQYDWITHSEKMERQWERMFLLVKKYKRENLHTRVPQHFIYCGESLGSWTTSQQSHYRDGKLKEHRKEKLNGIGFEWIRDERFLWKGTRPLGKLDDDWNEKFSIRCDYKDQHNDTLVPVDYVAKLHDGEEFSFGAFVIRQRQLFRDGLLREERKEKLESIGFVFEIDIYDAEASRNQKEWDEMCQFLCQYKEKEGNCDVPTNYQGTPKLAMWVRTQRSLHSRNELSPIRFEKLDYLGFTWVPNEERWNKMVNHLKSYKSLHGDCLVPYSYQTNDGVKLGSWVQTCRGGRRGTKGDWEVSADKIAELDSLGFVWDNVLHLNWESMYESLKKFKEREGHTRVPQSCAEPPGLGSFVAQQRHMLEKRLEKTGDSEYIKRREKLNQIGFEWHIHQDNWDAMFEGLRQYNEKYKDCCVPYSYKNEVDGLPRQLGPWVSAQRLELQATAKEGNEIFTERKRRLDSIGFDWDFDVLESNWMKMLEKLKEYHSANGNCRVPADFDEGCEELPAKLGNWVSVQKSNVLQRAAEGIPVYIERKKKLDEINFEYEHVFKEKWDNMLKRLSAYHSKYGNCRVPIEYGDGNGEANLAAWVRSQQSVCEKAAGGNPKYAERKRLLDTLNFEYCKIDDANWKFMFNLLKRYNAESGHVDVPIKFTYDDIGGPRASLGGWCYEQRKNIPARIGKDNVNNDYEERKKLLDSVGFKWVVEHEATKQWNACFERLKRFKENKGHCFVPPSDSTNDQASSLYAWVRRQERILVKVENGDAEAIERKSRLDSIGFEWKSNSDNVWDNMFSSMVEYHQKHGNCQVPYRGSVQGPTGQLGIWSYKQRTRLPQKVSKGDPVSIQRKQRLDSIGFEWLDVHSSKWEVMYEGLARFHKKFGHCRVKRDYKDQDQPTNLGSWCSSQRKGTIDGVNKGDSVAIERKQRLDSMGFVWQTRAPPKAYTRNGTIVQGRQKPGASVSIEKPKKKDDKSRHSSAKKTNSTMQVPQDAAPGPDGRLVPFPEYDGNEEPRIWKKSFRQFSRLQKNDVRESLDPSTLSKEAIKHALKEKWSRLASSKKEVYEKWSEWDKMRYYRDVSIFEKKKKKAPHKRKSPPEDQNRVPKKTKKRQHTNQASQTPSLP